MANEKSYNLTKWDCKLTLTPKGDGNVWLNIKKPLHLEHEGIGLTAKEIYGIICYSFENVPEEACKTIEWGMYSFERESSELDFYKEISKKLEF